MLDISSATKSDSKAMKTVALVTMVFLPATFTSVRHTPLHIQQPVTDQLYLGRLQHELFQLLPRNG